jgi:hypothetical protein
MTGSVCACGFDYLPECARCVRSSLDSGDIWGLRKVRNCSCRFVSGKNYTQQPGVCQQIISPFREN